MDKVELGQRLRLRPSTYRVANEETRKLDGTVVYIHPKGRFFTVEFRTPYGSFRESFKLLQKGRR